MTSSPVNPRPFLATLIGVQIVVKLKWGMEYRGLLKCADAYMNLQMHNVAEYVDGEKQCVLNELLIRCNNILYVRTMVKESSKDEEAME